MKHVVLMIVYISLMLLLSHTTRASLAKPGCQERCGNIIVPFPYGIGNGCYLHKSFEVSCNHDLSTLHFLHNHKFSILEISLESIRVINKPNIACIYPSPIPAITTHIRLDKYFSYSHHRNMYVALGCDITTTFRVEDSTGGKEDECVSTCQFPPTTVHACMFLSFTGCCQRSIPIETSSYSVRINYKHNFSTCSAAFIAEKNFKRSLFYTHENLTNVPVALNWVIALGTCHKARVRGENLCGKNSYCFDSTMGHGYNCRCIKGFQGNPYLPSGCKDINECSDQNNHPCKRGELCVNTYGSYECNPQHPNKTIWGMIAAAGGLLAFRAIGYWGFTRLAIRKRNATKLNFFRRHGGNLLNQHISTNKSCVMKIKIYSIEEMHKATKGFSQKQFLGKGGQGTVYKGLLSNGTVVAIKKLNAIDEDQVKHFVNELLILAEINHRNVVRLLGCCFEYEFRLLVYEYLSNGTLSEHFFDGEEVSKFSWKERIRIAKEVAEALAYLHSHASSTIFHRDIKPANILLDENYRAVLSDFGLSRSIPRSRTHLTTQVEGTFGYLDPEYFHSGQFTAKSDVYSFGVVLTERLTRKKADSSLDLDDSLIPRFQFLMKYNRVFEILDKQVMHESWMDDVTLVTKLAKRCMKRNAKKRPSMKEVVADLDKIRLVQPEFPLKSITDDFTLTLR